MISILANNTSVNKNPVESGTIIYAIHKHPYRRGLRCQTRIGIAMPDPSEKPDKGQIWMTIGPDLRQTYAKWCKGNGYDKTLVFLAGWLSILKLDYGERKTLFESIDDIGMLAKDQSGETPGAKPKQARPHKAKSS